MAKGAICAECLASMHAHCIGQGCYCDCAFELNNHSVEEDEVPFIDEDDGCYECGGEGWVLRDCFEDTCCCADPETEHGYRPCSLCNSAARRGKE